MTLQESLIKELENNLLEDYTELSSKQRNKNEKCAQEIINWLKKNEIDMDTAIMYNGKYIDIDDNVEKEIESASEYVEYYNDDTITMTFEGPLYGVLNYNGPDYEWNEKMENEFSQILKKYGYYYELGNAWNLALYDL